MLLIWVMLMLIPLKASSFSSVFSLPFCMLGGTRDIGITVLTVEPDGVLVGPVDLG